MKHAKQSGTQGLIQPDENVILTLDMLKEEEEPQDASQVSLNDYLPNVPSTERNGQLDMKVSTSPTLHTTHNTKDMETMKKTEDNTNQTLIEDEITGAEGINDMGNTEGKTQSTKDIFTRIDPLDVEALRKYALSTGCTAQGAARFAATIGSENFKSREVLIYDLTEDLRENGDLGLLKGAIVQMTNKTKLAPISKPRAGFTFNEKVAQRAYYVKGITRTELVEPDERGRTRGHAPAHYVLLPETTPGVKVPPSAANAMGVSLEPYNPILRILAHFVTDEGIREAWFSNMQGRAFDAYDAKSARELGNDLPGLIYDIMVDAGQTDEELLLTYTTRAEIVGRSIQRLYRNGGRQSTGTAVSKDASTVPASNTLANAGLSNAMDKLALMGA